MTAPTRIVPPSTPASPGSRVAGPQRVDEIVVVASDSLGAIVVQELGKMGRAARRFTTPKEALRYLALAIPDSIVVGVDRARGSRWDLVEELRRSTQRRIPLVVVSSASDVLPKFQRQGAGPFAADQYVWGVSGRDGVEIISAVMDAEMGLPRKMRGASER